MKSLINKWIIYIWLILLFVSCGRKLFVYKSNEVLGHGGMGIKAFYPLDSYQSLHKAYVRYDGTEGDVQITKDSVLVFWHNRTAPNSNEYISDLNYNELKTYRYLSKKYNVCRVDSFLNLHQNNKIISLDVKLYGCDDDCRYKIANAVKLLVKRHRRENTFFVETNDYKLLNILAEEHNYTLFYYASDIDDALSKEAEGIDFEGVSIHYSLLNSGEVKLLHLKKLKVMMWGMKTKKQLEKAISKGADYYQTDAKITIVR